MAPRNPFPTVDVIIETEGGIVLIERRNEPRGWALPGGFVDYGERMEDAARREAREETGLDVTLTDLLGVYSDPSRDPRQHNLSAVYVGHAQGTPRGGDDAARARVYPVGAWPAPLCFDHARILADYVRFRATGERPAPAPPPSHLSPEDRAALLRVARDALTAAVTGRPVPTGEAERAPESAGVLGRPAACFVTLRGPDGALRGCIGTLTARRPLGEEVRAMAAAAAREDRRFQPVTASELDGIHIAVSVLSDTVVVEDPEAIRIGVHGLHVVKGPHRGVLLPHVALEHGWDRDTFLRQTCFKAGLDPEAFRDPDTEVRVFTAEKIEEDR